MSHTVEALARITSSRTLGDGQAVVTGLYALDEASPSGLSPYFRKNKLETAPVMPMAVLADAPLAAVAIRVGVSAALVHPAPAMALAKLIDLFFPAPAVPGGADVTAVVHPGAIVHPTAVVGPLAVVEAGVVIGADSVVGPGAVICSGTIIGDRVRIGPGAIIGHDGFGFVPSPGCPVRIRQVGRVVIEDDVDVGANACVDRATLGTTRVGAGSKIDNLVQVGHNSRIGRRVLVAGQAGLAGSVTVEDDAQIGGNAGIADHLTVGRGARVAAKSGVIGDIPAGAVVAGYPAVDRVRWLRRVASAERSLGTRGKERRS